MDYEKKYKEALARARNLHKDAIDMESTLCAKQCEIIFPELKESEDERIRKHLISLVKNWDKDGIVSKYTSNSKEIKQILAWLEKQGEIDKTSYEIAENEKREFVGDGFIKCYADFQDFKEGETYWLEYLGNDNYNVRSDNLLGKTYHITPCQLYTIFKKQTWLEKQGEKPQQTPQWMINFLNENRAKFASSMDYDEQIEAGGKLDAIIDWLEKQGEIDKTSYEIAELEELVNDMMMLIASFSGRLYSARAKENAKKRKENKNEQ